MWLLNDSAAPLTAQGVNARALDVGPNDVRLGFGELYLPYMNVATFFGIMLALCFLAFLANLIQTYGPRTVIGLFIPSISKAK